ncbi:MAG: hypothetical protein ILP22_09135, partial [Oscillospiraceae bacterium]|nr:hypothetical protein [Oscillospiraceae bacterium]
MTGEDLYKAIGDIDDEYLVIKKIKPFSYETNKIPIIYDTKKTRKTGVPLKRKVLFPLAAAVLALAVGGAAVAACYGLKRYKESKTIGYFTEDKDFDSCIRTPELIASDGENIYYSGCNTYKDSWKRVTFHDIETGEEQFVKIEDIGEDSELLSVNAEGNDLWFLAYDMYKTRNINPRLIRADRSTGEVNGNIALSENEDIIQVKAMEDGGYLIGKAVSDPEEAFTGYSHQIYDKNLNLVSEKQIIDPAPMINEGYGLADILSDEDGSVLALFENDEHKLRLVTYSAEGEELRSADLNTEKSDGLLLNSSLCRDGSLLLAYHSVRKSYCLLEKHDTETGEVTASYEFELPGNFSMWYMCKSVSPDYDVMAYSYPYMYGISISEGKSTKLTDLSVHTFLDPYNRAPNIKLSGNEIMFTETEYEETDEYFGKRCLMKSDIKGKRTECISAETDLGLGIKTYIKQVRTADNGELHLLAGSTVSKSPDETYEEFYFIITDSELNIKKKVCLGPHVNSYEFIADSKGRLLLYENLSHDLVFCDAAFDGSEKMKPAGNFPEAFFFRSGSDCFCLAPSSETGKTVVYKIDFENKGLSKTDTLDFAVKEAEDGDGSYDAYF